MGGIYEVRSGSSVMIYITILRNIYLGVQKLMGEGGIRTQTHRHNGDPVRILLFLKIKKAGWK
jgi:hypothetical protein